jgi:hypothetical protein
MYRVGDAGDYLANPPELKKVHDPSRANFFEKKLSMNFFLRFGYLSTWNRTRQIVESPEVVPQTMT